MALGRAFGEVQFRWKEECIYWEGDDGFIFDGGWGPTPAVTYVPDEDTWDRVVPDWMVGRRAEIVRRLEIESFHVVEPGWMYSPGDSWRRISRGAT